MDGNYFKQLLKRLRGSHQCINNRFQKRNESNAIHYKWSHQRSLYTIVKESNLFPGITLFTLVVFVSSFVSWKLCPLASKIYFVLLVFNCNEPCFKLNACINDNTTLLYSWKHLKHLPFSRKISQTALLLFHGLRNKNTSMLSSKNNIKSMIKAFEKGMVACKKMTNAWKFKY